MPTYEYQCSECGAIFDVFQSIKASPLRKAECEACGQKRPVRRLIGTGGAVIFKGSGFYQTDYRSENYKNAAKSENGKSDSNSTGSSASDTSSAGSNAKAGGKSEKSKGSAGGAKAPAPSRSASKSGD